tara:strand:- start:11 stop:307 length:297 start_codon:yes stop_codon:yes gene_type:complete
MAVKRQARGRPVFSVKAPHKIKKGLDGRPSPGKIATHARRKRAFSLDVESSQSQNAFILSSHPEGSSMAKNPQKKSIVIEPKTVAGHGLPRFPRDGME